MTPSAQSLLNEMARAGYNGRKAGEKLAYIAKEYNPYAEWLKIPEFSPYTLKYEEEDRDDEYDEQ